METIGSAYARFCRERFPSPTDQQVVELESSLGVLFPHEYRKFLLDYNGGFFDEPLIGSTLHGLTALSGIGATHPAAELGSPSSLALFEDNRPPQILPIGYTATNALLLLVIDQESDEDGSILLKEPFSEVVSYLADNIQGFFALLQDHGGS